MYCSEVAILFTNLKVLKVTLEGRADDDKPYGGCSADTAAVRDGVNMLGLREFGLEPLLHQYGVDLFLCGHEHIYERLFPVFQGKVYKNAADPYHNPQVSCVPHCLHE